ncbi:MAG: efflux RND transporter periplasmic adaptor subunit [Patescibacteria group bacterium]
MFKFTTIFAHAPKLKKLVLGHPYISTVAAIAFVGVVWFGGQALFKAPAQTRYVLGEVTIGTIVSSISASGQVSASNQLDIKPEVSGKVTSISIKAGDKVKAGQLLVSLDASSAQKSVRDAQASLESAQISLEKLQKPASALSLTQAQNALTNAQDALVKDYTDSATDIVNAFLDLPDIITNLEDIQIGDDACRNSQWNLDCYTNAISQYDSRTKTYRDTAYSDYIAAKKAYDAAFATYQSLGNTPDNASIEAALTQTYSAVQLTSKAVKSTNAFIQLYKDALEGKNLTPAAAATEALTDLNTYTGKLNTHLSTLLTDANELKQDKQTITEKQQSLAETTAGTDALDLKSSQLSVTQKQNALQDAYDTLAKYYLRAPFDGTIASVDVQRFATAGSGASVATLITEQKIAELSLSEVDVAKVKAGAKATLTFDAIDDLSLTGTVVSIDTVGTVDQGVVSYTVKIGFDSQDDRIKSGMTVNASIQTDIKTDVLMVPSSAVKTQGGVSYVQMFEPALVDPSSQGIVTSKTPRRIQVTTGISDDTNIEIVSGLTEGQQIVTRTTNAAATPSTSTGNSTGARPSGMGGGGPSGAVFIKR